MIWHGLRANDDYVMKDRATRLWFEQATKILFALRYAQYSGFAGQISDCYTQLGAFGTKGMFIDEFDTSEHPYQAGIRYKSIPLGELFISKNHQGIVDGFCRWFRLKRTAGVSEIRSARFPEVLRPALEKGASSHTIFCTASTRGQARITILRGLMSAANRGLVYYLSIPASVCFPKVDTVNFRRPFPPTPRRRGRITPLTGDDGATSVEDAERRESARFSSRATARPTRCFSPPTMAWSICRFAPAR